MRKLKDTVKKILFKLKITNNKIFCKLNKKKFNQSVAIISCNKYQNKVKEDILLKIELNHLYVNADIIPWQDETIDYQKYDALIIRSVWGYQEKILEFTNWLKELEKDNIKVYNEPKLMLDNINKKKQFKLLDDYKIPHIETKFLNSKDLENPTKLENLLNQYGSIVTKPIISGGGANTFVIGSNTKNSIKLKDISKKYSKVLNKINNYIMVQPFIKEINDGEYSFVFINNSLTTIVKRITNIFNDKNLVQVIDTENVSKKALQLASKISKIKEYKKALYLRVDLVKIENEYKVMETELVDPQLFLEYRQNNLKKFAQEIKKKIS